MCEIQRAREPGRESEIECEIKCESDGDKGGVKLRLARKAGGKGSEEQENMQSTNNLRKRAQTSTSVDQE